MNTTLEERKNQAIEYMRKLDIYKPYINGFAKNDKVCFYEGFGGYWAYQEPELLAKQKEIEEKYHCTVYAITHEFTEIGEMWDFLVVTDYKEEWKDLVVKDKDNTTYAFAYVWNKDDDYCSEFGTIALKSFGGGIRRIG